MTWDQLDITQAHRSYALIGTFSCLFCLFSLLLKEKVFINEAVVSTFTGAIFGPKAINLVNPLEWSTNKDYLTQEISRIILIIQIFAVSVELPPRYLKANAIPLIVLLVFTMVMGWLITGLFAWLIFPKFNFIDALAVTATITATDPVLSAAIVGKGKFGERVPSYLRQIISAESGANDGLAFPFVLLAVNILLHPSNARVVVRDWICIGILYECVLGVLLGIVIGWCGRQLIKQCEKRKFVDIESLLIFYVFLSLICTGVGSIIGVDDLLVSFAAGAAFAWDGWFVEKAKGQHLSASLDMLLNVGYFLYYGSIIPWDDFSSEELGLGWGRMILWSLVAIFLRRIPATLLSMPFVSTIHNWKEALFVGMFGPVGVGGIFCSVIVKSSIEKHYTKEVPAAQLTPDFAHYYVLRTVWPIVAFTVLTSVIVHGFAVTAMVYSSKIAKIVVKEGSALKESETSDDAEQADETISLQEIETGDKKSPDHVPLEGSSKTLHHRKPTSRAKFLNQEQLKIYSIGKEIVVESSNKEFIKRYEINSDGDDEELNSEKLTIIAESDLAANYSDSELRTLIERILSPK